MGYRRRRKTRWLLYRTFTHAGEPLYFGITSRTFHARLAEHAATSAWVELRDPDRDVVERIGGGRAMTRSEAEVVEAAAIGEVGGTLANREFNGGAGRDLSARIESGHPDPGYSRRAARGGESAAVGCVAALWFYAPWLGLLLVIAVAVVAAAR